MSAVSLPPLPPAPDEGYRPGGRSIADIVDREHRQLLALLDQLAASAGSAGAQRDGLAVLTAALSRHLSAEEQYLLPAVRAALPEHAGRVDEEIDGDAGLLAALKGLTDETLTEVAERVRRHVDGVGGLVAELRAVATQEELIRLGNRWRSPRRRRRRGHIRAPRGRRRGTGSSSRRWVWWTRFVTR